MPLIPIQELLKGIRQGNRTALSRAITLAESKRPDHRMMSMELVDQCMSKAGESIRVGFTGVPGAGKSSLIEAIGLHVIETGSKVAVLAIDPSSERSKGSILGDKTRMSRLSMHPNAYVRPSPASGALGGVAPHTREAIVLCEAAGFDTIFIETVGVGQSETQVRSMVDFYLLLMITGAGDSLQGIKRGVIEMADAIAVTKSDGDNVESARRVEAELKQVLHLFEALVPGWTSRVQRCSSVTLEGVAELWDLILEQDRILRENGERDRRRRLQALEWMRHSVMDQLRTAFETSPEVVQLKKQLEEKVQSGETHPMVAARQLTGRFLQSVRSSDD